MALDSGVSTSIEGTLTPAEADAAHVIHPQTRIDTHTASNVVVMERAKGVRMWDVDGNEWLDAVCGQVNISFGYGRPEIAEAVSRVVRDLSFSTLFNSQGNVIVSEFVEELAKVTPTGVDRFFFTTGGSDAIETALKFARYAFAMNGRPEKTAVIGRTKSYHGMTFGATTATGNVTNWEGFGPMLPGVSHIGQPDVNAIDPGSELEDRILELGPENVAAFIAEPVSLPSGLVIPPPTYWARIREICDRYEVLLIADEVICGFGRTGAMFGMDNWGITPDLMAMSKAINNGVIPMGVVGMTDAMVARLTVPGRKLAHGFTSGGNTAACAAGTATLKLIADGDVLNLTQRMASHMTDVVTRAMASHDRITGFRVMGGMLSVELEQDVADAAPVAQLVVSGLRGRRVLSRAFSGDAVFYAPALTTTPDELDEMLTHLDEVIRSV